MDYHNQQKWLKRRRRENRIRRKYNIARNRPMTKARRALHKTRHGDPGGGLLRAFVNWALSMRKQGEVTSGP